MGRRADCESRRQFLQAVIGGAFLVAAGPRGCDLGPGETREKPTPVILDTDIGSDIDDTWALAMLLKSPELDVRLVTSGMGDTVYRARIIAKMLQVAGRTDVPVGVGVRAGSGGGPQGPWVEGYELDDYPGTVFDDGVQAMLEVLGAAAEPVTLICIGPLPNIAELLRRDPAAARRAHFVGMHGSVRLGYGGRSTPDAEWNVRGEVAACRATFAADWLSRTITPLDTCGLVHLRGENYARLLDSHDPVVQALLENYRIWSATAAEDWARGRPDTESTTLFDTVAVHLAHSREFLRMERMRLRVTDDGYTVEDPAGPELDVAIEWTDLDGYHEHLSRRLLGPVVPPRRG